MVSTLVTIRNTILMFLNDPDPQHQFARVIKVTNFQVMAILSCLAALLLLLISSFALMEDINSSMSSSSIWQELETGSSYTPSINVHSNMTNDLSRERAVHRLRTGVYATEVKLFKGNPLVANQWLITTTCCATSKVQDYCQKVPVGLFITRPSVMEVSP